MLTFPSYFRDEYSSGISLTLPERGAAVVLITAHENMKPVT
jgi:hypothetical protein